MGLITGIFGHGHIDVRAGDCQIQWDHRSACGSRLCNEEEEGVTLVSEALFKAKNTLVTYSCLFKNNILIVNG